MRYRGIPAPIYAVLVCGCLLATSDSIRAAIIWNQPTFGNYTFASSWSPQVIPDSTTPIEFGATQGTTLTDVTVRFPLNVASNGTKVVSGDYTFLFAKPG